MSEDKRQTYLSTSTHSSRPSVGAVPQIPPTALTPDNTDQEFEPCAATGSFFLYAQRSTILVLHQDTLAIERRFDLHREDVKFIHVDNVSERGTGRMAVSYDAGSTAIVWDIFNGAEIARFSAYDHINVACFMRNGNIAFGNVQGSIILFEPATSEHISARTIFDPITAIAPAADCRTFAIGYLNGSILVATIHPAFTIQHTLTTSRAPSRITGLAWHGASSKAKTDMLATQTQDGDLRVWSVPKAPHNEQPMIIRVLNRNDAPTHGPNWFAWSKNGRIVQHLDGETRAWDVRTKRVTFDVIPTIENVTGIANYGPTATLFTLGRNHTVQQYDINPNTSPMQVSSVQHVPANTPPTPPMNFDEPRPYSAQSKDYGGTMPMYSNNLTDGESSASEGVASPLDKIAREMRSLDVLESELRDKVTPLSPSVSSRASSVSSKSSGRHFRQRKYLYDRPGSSQASSVSGYEGTEFSYGVSAAPGRESMSIRSSASVTSSKYRGSHLRNQVLRSPMEVQDERTTELDLFPSVKARLKEIDFRTPMYGNGVRTPDVLRREMLSVVFGWNDEVATMIRDEMARHRPGSAAAVLLARWLGELGADAMAAMVGSEAMSSSDWMLLALSSIRVDTQKKVGEAFVQRLLEKGDIHPAAAILLGMGEANDAIEVYVSQGYWMEALLLCCLTMPNDWGRQSYLLRQWGPIAVQEGQAELAVRIFSCASVESTDNWFSPRAQQDAGYTQAQSLMYDPQGSAPLASPPLMSPNSRLTEKNASLKLTVNTTFNHKKKNSIMANEAGPTPLAGFTPIAQSALSPRAGTNWQSRLRRDNSEVRTATPGREKRLPSRDDIERAKAEAAVMATPLTTTRARAPSSSRLGRNSSMNRGHDTPMTAVKPKSKASALDDGSSEHLPSPSAGTFNRIRENSRQRERNPSRLAVEVMDVRYENETMSPSAMTGASLKNAKSKAIDDYISSVEKARVTARAESKRREKSRTRGDSRSRAASRPREVSREPKQIRRSKGSPSSPVSMSPDTHAAAQSYKIEQATADDEDFYRIASPINAGKVDMMNFTMVEPKSQEKARLSDPVTSDRGRSDMRDVRKIGRSPSVPSLSSSDLSQTREDRDVRRQTRGTSASRAGERRTASKSRNRSASRRPAEIDNDAESRQDNDSQPSARPRNKIKEAAARELEERRMSLARRPSAPAIPLPTDLSRPSPSRTGSENLLTNLSAYTSPFSRSHTVDPDAMARLNKTSGTSTSSTPIGLPATPRAMRHPRYMSQNPEKEAPPVPVIPENLSLLSGSGSGVSSAAPSSLSQISSTLTSGSGPQTAVSTVAPLLPSSVYQKPTGPRSASAPPEKMPNDGPLLPGSAYQPDRPRRMSGRKQSTDKSIAEALSPLKTNLEDNVVNVPEARPAVLPELQHLAGPPPPPPAPAMISPAGGSLGMINIAIDGLESNVSSDVSSGLAAAPFQLPQAMDRAVTTSPAMSSQKGRRGSIGGESLSSRMRGVADRMRSSSRTGRVKSPVIERNAPAPYETKFGYETNTSAASRAKSPYELAMAGGSQDVIPVPPPAPSGPPMGGYDARLNETSIPPSQRAPSAGGNGGYRNPKEIRANMPPDFTQTGVQGGFL